MQVGERPREPSNLGARHAPTTSRTSPHQILLPICIVVVSYVTELLYALSGRRKIGATQDRGPGETLENTPAEPGNFAKLLMFQTETLDDSRRWNGHRVFSGGIDNFMGVEVQFEHHCGINRVGN